LSPGWFVAGSGLSRTCGYPWILLRQFIRTRNGWGSLLCLCSGRLLCLRFTVTAYLRILIRIL
jgi:hypothetical protein